MELESSIRGPVPYPLCSLGRSLPPPTVLGAPVPARGRTPTPAMPPRALPAKQSAWYRGTSAPQPKTTAEAKQASTEGGSRCGVMFGPLLSVG